MSGRSVAFIEPAGSEANVFDRYMRLPLMGSLYLATILDREGYDVRIYNENIQSEPFDPYEVKADVFCLSALTVNANRARQLARQIRQIHPNARIVVGGIHASLVPGEFDEVADTIVLGEAESVIVDVIEGRVDEKIVHGAHVEDLVFCLSWCLSSSSLPSSSFRRYLLMATFGGEARNLGAHV